MNSSCLIWYLLFLSRLGRLYIVFSTMEHVNPSLKIGRLLWTSDVHSIMLTIRMHVDYLYDTLLSCKHYRIMGQFLAYFTTRNESRLSSSKVMCISLTEEVNKMATRQRADDMNEASTSNSINNNEVHSVSRIALFRNVCESQRY